MPGPQQLVVAALASLSVALRRNPIIRAAQWAQARCAIRCWGRAGFAGAGLALSAESAFVVFGRGLYGVQWPQAFASASGGQPSPGGSWGVQVERLRGGIVYDAILEPGQSKDLPLGSGLKIRSGRPDLLYVGAGMTPDERLGAVTDIAWFECRPSASMVALQP